MDRNDVAYYKESAFALKYCYLKKKMKFYIVSLEYSTMIDITCQLMACTPEFMTLFVYPQVEKKYTK